MLFTNRRSEMTFCWQVRCSDFDMLLAEVFCFTSTETVGLLGTGSPGRPPRLLHSTWALVWHVVFTQVLLGVQFTKTSSLKHDFCLMSWQFSLWRLCFLHQQVLFDQHVFAFSRIWNLHHWNLEYANVHTGTSRIWNLHHWNLEYANAHAGACASISKIFGWELLEHKDKWILRWL